MKMAIVGSGPLAILSALHFDQMGAEVVLFQRSPLGGNVRFLMEHFPDFILKHQEREFKACDFFETVLVPAILEVESHGLSKQGDVLRVHKRFLHKSEEIVGHTRMHDLFRLVYALNPQENILKQLALNPEIFKELGEEVVNSLHLPVESYEDFDIVIEARGLGKVPKAMGAGGSLALNENNLKESALLYYEKDIFTKLELKDKKSIILVGEGVSAKLALLKFREWLRHSSGSQLHWVTYQRAEEKTGLAWLDEEVASFFKEVEERFESSKEEFEKKLRDWRELDDFVRVKMPRPEEPRPFVAIHQGADVTSVDRLVDRAGVFATIECPSFRNFGPGQKELQTLAADALCVARGVKEGERLGEGLRQTEPGYYVLESMEEIASIEADILNYFKKA